MLKQVMWGAGGILLAAAIFASSVTPSAVPGSPSDAPVVTPVATPGAAPTVQPQVATSPKPTPVFEAESGDTVFGAPMVSTAPMASTRTEPPPTVTDPDSALANGGRQFNAKPGRPYPIPK